MPQAIRCFLAQDYAEKELVIVDDGADPMADLPPNDARVRYRRAETREHSHDSLERTTVPEQPI